MPARGSSGGGAINPTKIKAAAKKAAPPAKALPAYQKPTKPPTGLRSPAHTGAKQEPRGLRSPAHTAPQVVGYRLKAAPGKPVTHVHGGGGQWTAVTESGQEIPVSRKSVPTAGRVKGYAQREAEQKEIKGHPYKFGPHGLESYAVKEKGGDLVRHQGGFVKGMVVPAGVPTLPLALASKVGGKIAEAAGVKGKIPNELVSIGTLPLIAGYKALEGGLQATKGNTKPISELAKGVAEATDKGALGQLLIHGNVGGAVKAAKAAPVFTAAEVLGLEGATGRAAGLVKRKVTPGVGGTTIRPPVSLTQDAGSAARPSGVHQRRYSKDLWREQIQKAAERRKPMLDSQDKPVMVNELGHQVPVLKPKNEHEEIRLQKKRARFEAGEKQANEFRARQEAEHEISKIESPGKTPRKVVKGRELRELGHIIATARIRTPETFREDLLKERVKTEAALAKHEKRAKEGRDSNFRTADEKRRAEQNVKMFRNVEADPKLDEKIPALIRMGEGFGAAGHRADIRAAELGIREAGEMERARLSETAYAHQGARYHSTHALEALEQEARVHEDEVATEIQKMRPGPERKGLEDLHQALREDRIAVSGRDPEAMAKYEEMQQAAEAATARRVEAQRASGAPEHRPMERMAAAGEARGPKPAERMQAAGETGGEARLRLAEAEEKVAHMEAKEAKKPPVEEGIRKATGHHLSTDEMREALEATGRDPRTVSYVPHVVGTSGKGAYHMPFRPSMRPSPFPERTRTGALQERGVTEISTEAVAREQVKKGVMANLAEHIDSLMHDQALKAPNGKPFDSPKAAAEFAGRLASEGKGQWTPIQPMRAGLSDKLKEIVAEHQTTGTMDTIHLEMLRSRLPSESGATSGQTLLIPTHLLKEHLALAQGSNEVEKVFQSMVGPFRRAVLSQDRWLVGNVVEPYLIRLPLYGAGINLPGLGVDVAAALKVTKAGAKGDAKLQWANKQLIAHQLQSGRFVGKQRAASTHVTYEDMSGALRNAFITGHVIRRLPVVKQVADMAIGLTDAFFHMNKGIETSTAYQAFGKLAREDIQNFTGKFYETLKLGKQATNEIARYQERTATRERYAKSMNEMLGQYDDWGPFMKRMVRAYTPFVPWTLASLRLMYWTIPAHHSAAFATLMKLGQSVIGDWEKEHAELHAAGIKGTLANSVVSKKAGEPPGYMDIFRYTPGGITMPIKEGDFQGITSLVTPQIQGAEEALSGRGAFGQPLKVAKTLANPKGEVTDPLDLVKIATNSFLESITPFLGQSRRLLEKGGTPYDNANLIDEIKRRIEGREPNIKPGSSYESAPNRVLNPFRVTHIAPKKGTGRKPRKPSAGSGFGSGGESGFGAKGESGFGGG